MPTLKTVPIIFSAIVTRLKAAINSLSKWGLQLFLDMRHDVTF